MDRLSLELARRISALKKPDRPTIVAIDGRCASGKTTLAARLEEILGCTVVHLDDYFLRPEQRTPERLAAAGGNIDYERFLAEALLPLRSGIKELSLRRFDCHLMELIPPERLRPAPIVVAEGSYSCHPALWDSYDLRVFLTVSPKEQLRRIALRGGESALAAFRERWIPLEEAYFKAFDIAARCDAVFENE